MSIIEEEPRFTTESDVLRQIMGERQLYVNYRRLIHHATATTAGTAAYACSNAAAATATSLIGRTELTLVLSGDADNASTNGKTYTLVYLDADGTSHTAVGTGTATLNGTPVAFVPAVADFYCPVSFTASAADANVNVYAMVSGGTIHATIATTATTATEANMRGVGALWGRTHTNDNDGDGAILYMEYLNPWGTIKYGNCTINTTDGTTEVRFYEGSYSAGTFTLGTTTTVKDFYRVRKLWTNQTPTANTHVFILTDDACANVDGSGGDIYGIIDEGDLSMTHCIYHCPLGYSAWVCGFNANFNIAAVGDDYTIKINYTKGGIAEVLYWDVTDNFKSDLPAFKIDADTDVYLSVLDGGAACVASTDMIIIEAEEATLS